MEKMDEDNKHELVKRFDHLDRRISENIAQNNAELVDDLLKEMLYKQIK